jgi:hypothetical protein
VTGHEPVGSLGEEAAKLIAALQGWASSRGGEPSGDATNGAAGEADSSGTSGAAHSAANGVGEPARASGVGGHTGHDPLSPECRYCPICQLVRVARQTSPEVREHLTSAVLSLTLAIKGLLEGTERERSHRSEPVEKIDLLED